MPARAKSAATWACRSACSAMPWTSRRCARTVPSAGQRTVRSSRSSRVRAVPRTPTAGVVMARRPLGLWRGQDELADPDAVHPHVQVELRARHAMRAEDRFHVRPMIAAVVDELRGDHGRGEVLAFPLDAQGRVVVGREVALHALGIAPRALAQLVQRDESLPRSERSARRKLAGEMAEVTLLRTDDVLERGVDRAVRAGHGPRELRGREVGAERDELDVRPTVMPRGREENAVAHRGTPVPVRAYVGIVAPAAVQRIRAGSSLLWRWGRVELPVQGR